MTEMLNVYVKSKQLLAKPDEKLEDVAQPEPADELADSTEELKNAALPPAEPVKELENAAWSCAIL